MSSSQTLVALFMLATLASARFLPSVPQTVSLENNEQIFQFIEGFFYGMSVQLDQPEVSKCFSFSADARSDLQKAIELFNAQDIHWLKYFGLFIAVIPDVEEYCYQTLKDAQIIEELIQSFSSVNEFVTQVGFNTLANAFNLYWIVNEGQAAHQANNTEGVGFAFGRAISAVLLQNQTNFLIQN